MMYEESGKEGSGKRALITGMRGFTGRYLVQELTLAGYQVFGSVVGGVQSENEIAADLTDKKQVAALIERVQPDVVVHLAAIAFVAHADIEAMYRVNILATRNLLEALSAQCKTPSAVLLASSANVYGNSAHIPITEATPLAPANDYAVSKAAMELMARLWFERLPITIARPFNYTGVGQSEQFLLPKIVSHYRRQAAQIELGNVDVARDFSDVRTIVQNYRRLLAIAPAGQTFNLCSGQAYTLAEVLALIAELAGYAMEVKVNPAFVRAGEVKCLVGSQAKLDAAIGAITPRYTLRDTLAWMLQG